MRYVPPSCVTERCTEHSLQGFHHGVCPFRRACHLRSKPSQRWHTSTLLTHLLISALKMREPSSLLLVCSVVWTTSATTHTKSVDNPSVSTRSPLGLSLLSPCPHRHPTARPHRLWSSISTRAPRSSDRTRSVSATMCSTSS